jgi:hypothetical protein
MLSSHRAARILRSIRPQNTPRISSGVDWLRRSPARHPGTRAKDRRPKNERIEAEVEASGTSLTEIFGVGPIVGNRMCKALLTQ